MAIAGLLKGENLLLTGPKATGKNILAENLAYIFNRPAYNVSFHVNKMCIRDSSRTEGIIPAIESAHAVAYAKKIVLQMRKDQIVVITISGRGDKDCAAIARYRGCLLYTSL